MAKEVEEKVMMCLLRMMIIQMIWNWTTVCFANIISMLSLEGIGATEYVKSCDILYLPFECCITVLFASLTLPA